MWLVHKEIEKKYINACKQIITNTENFKPLEILLSFNLLIKIFGCGAWI